LVALLTSPLRIPRPAIIAFINSLKTSPHVEIIHVDTALDEQAWQLLSQRQDKEWSLVDCASFILMKQRGLLEAFTTDDHFERMNTAGKPAVAPGECHILRFTRRFFYRSAG
jgi:uncharacterized protein